MTRDEYIISNLENLPEYILQKEKRCYLNIEKKYGYWVIKYTNLTKHLFSKHKDLLKAIEKIVEQLKSLDSKQRNDNQESWEKFIITLTQFKEVNGNCDVPSRYKDKWLAGKVHYVRDAYKKCILPGDKVEQLDRLGFIWEVRPDKWTRFIEELQEYYKMYGHYNVPRRDPNYKKLGSKVYLIRLDFNKNRLDKKRIFDLERIGFNWEVPKYLKNYKFQ